MILLYSEMINLSNMPLRAVADVSDFQRLRKLLTCKPDFLCCYLVNFGGFFVRLFYIFNFPRFLVGIFFFLRYLLFYILISLTSLERFFPVWYHRVPHTGILFNPEVKQRKDALNCPLHNL